jgi:hypothetical protein
MPTDSACWQKLRDRRTLVNNEHCLLDLDARLQALESELRSGSRPFSQPGTTSGNGPEAIGDGAEDSSGATNEQRLPDVTPIPVTARLPELHELDRQGRCWAYRSTTHEPLGRAWVLGTPVSLQLTRSWCSFTHWLPHWCLPLVEESDA